MQNKIKRLFTNYTNIIIVLIIITTFSGALRKWGNLPSMANNIFLLVMMLLPLYMLFFFANTKTTQLNPTIRPVFNIFCFILFILAVHPLNLTYFHGVFGIFMHLSFIAIILSYLKNKENFNEKKIIRIFFSILAIQLIVASVQYISPSDSTINLYADNRQEQDSDTLNEDEFTQDTAVVGEAIRVTGTFSYLGGYTAVLFFFLLFTFYLAKEKNIKFLLYLSPIIIYSALLSGSRATVGFILILLITFIITERKSLIKKPKPILAALATLSLVSIINLSLGDQLGLIDKTTVAYENFMSRVESSKEESEGRLTNDLLQVFKRDFDYRYTGIGLGSTYQGTIAIFGSSDIVKNTPMEGELFRLLMEGSIFYLILRWTFLIIIFSYLDIPLIMKTSLFLLFCIFSQNVFHIYNAVYFGIGLIILNQAYVKKVSCEKLSP